MGVMIFKKQGPTILIEKKTFFWKHLLPTNPWMAGCGLVLLRGVLLTLWGFSLLPSLLLLLLTLSPAPTSTTEVLADVEFLRALFRPSQSGVSVWQHTLVG